jgi:hypothetical protein
MLRVEQPVVFVGGDGRGHNKQTLLPLLHESIAEAGQLRRGRRISPIRRQLTHIDFFSAQVVRHLSYG